MQDLQWLFSTMAQTYGAILGIFGMISLYRLETNSNKIESSRDRAEQHLLSFPDTKATIGSSPEDIVGRWKGISKEKKELFRKSSPQGFLVIHNAVGRIERYMNWSAKTRKWFIIFIVVHVIIITASIFGLVYISKTASFENIIPCLAVIILAASIASTSMLSYFIFKD